MRRLWVRLTIAFGLVTLAAIIIAAVLANIQVSTQFRRFVTHSQMMETALPTLVDYYRVHGSWDGVEAVIENLPRPGGMGMGQGRGMRRGAPVFMLTDTAGRVVYSSTTGGMSTTLSRQELADALPVEVQGQVAGYVVLDAGDPPQTMLNTAAQSFLAQVNAALVQAGLIAGVLGILIGLLVARGLTAPLNRLTAAVRRISQGRLAERVTVTGAAEFTELAHAFNEMAASLEQAETLRRSMVADIAHELRTPLSVIQGNLQAILDDVFPLDKAEIASIYEETLTLNRLISDLRDLAQAEAGQLPLDIQTVLPGELVRGAADRFAELARDKGVRLTLEISADLPPVQADPDRIRQVLHNLLSNALRHTPAGGQITIRVDRLKAGGSFVRITVADTGPGIPPADLPHVFDRFWRADKSRSREQGGSGLGLAIARKLVEAHGGQIGVESEGIPGKGSRFWFTLRVM